MVFEVLLYYLIEYFLYITAYSFMIKKYVDKASFKLLFSIPLYSLLLLMSTLSPIPFDLPYSFIIAYLILLTLFLLVSSEIKDKGVVVVGVAFLMSYFLLSSIPFIATNCYSYSIVCVSSKSIFSISLTIVFSYGVLISILVSSYVYLYSDKHLYYRLLVITALTYMISPYLSLIPGLFTTWYLMPLVTLAFTILIYMLGSWIGGFMYSGLSLEKVFDKYVSVNILLTLLFLSIVMIIKELGYM